MSHLICLLVALIASTIRAPAQPILVVTEQGETLLVPDGTVPGSADGAPPGLVLPGRPGPPDAANATADPAEARLQKLLQLRVDRRPEILLQANARRFDPRGIPTNEVERLQFDITAGDWPAVGAFLSTLPTNHAPRVFDHIVQQLQTPPGQGGRPGAPGPPVMMPPMPGMPPPQNLLLPDDILGLAAACPAELTDQRLQALGQLLARTMPGLAVTRPILARLENGVGPLGGSDPAARRRAAKFLIAAGQLLDASQFVPALDTNTVPRDFALLDVHASLLTAQGRDASRRGERAASDRKQALVQAWSVTQLLLADTNCPAAERETALVRALDLLPGLNRELGSNWLHDNFVHHPQLGAALIAQVGAKVARGATERQAEPRSRNLKQQKQAVDALLDSSADRESWQSFLQVMAAGWIRDAEFTRSRPSMPQNVGPQFDEFGNQVYFGPQNRFQDPNQPEPIAAEQLLESTPDERWLTQLDAPTAARLRVLRIQIQIRASRFDDAMPALADVAKIDPKLARTLALELLNGWAETRQPNRQAMFPRRYFNPYMPQGPEGIPLTRAHQQRNLDELGLLLAQIRILPLDPLDDTALISAFTRAHSQAEVFRIGDVERVFGNLDTLRPETLAELLQTMRSRLAGQWRQPRVQQEANTKRNDKEIASEVRRGYELVDRLGTQALTQKPGDWRLTLARAATLYDWAEFEYGQKVDLAVYTARRDEAFDLFARAATLYAAEVPGMEDAEQSPRVFQQWFNATLGASDLSYLTRQTEPSTNQLARIRRAILTLPGDAADRHLAAFGRELADNSGTLKPELKPRYARAGLEVVGDHASAREARELVRHYDDLLREIILSVSVDGDTTVGHDRTFGVFVGILHTEAVARESGGFAKYLQNQGNQGYYFNPYGGGPVNYRDEFEKQVKEKYADGFDILTVTFHDDKVTPRGTDRPGWRVFPYAYLLLKARDGSVDTLPALQLSMDFMDQRGQVSLAIASAPVLIDARPDAPPPRPVRKLEIVQTLDDRELFKGTATLEVKATARGLVPDLDRLFDVSVPGFRISRIDDRGLTLSQMESDEQITPISERDWLITLQSETTVGESLDFAFPKPRSDDVKVTYKRYADSDLVEVPSQLALAGLPLRPDYSWYWALLGSAVLGALGFMGWRQRRSSGVAATSIPTYAVPPEVTPFSVIHLLQRLQRDGSLPFTDVQRQELAATLADLQHRYFDREAGTNHQPDLQAVAERWVTAVR